MSKGPKINYKYRNFTSRDSLGINSASNAMQRELCSVIIRNTSRAFYWIFMIWNYYDYLINSGLKSSEWNDRIFKKTFLKKNDYFFIMSNLLNPESDKDHLVGKTNIARDLAKNPEGPFEYNEGYYSASEGGMQYYYAGCERMGFVTQNGSNDEVYDFPRITEEMGKPMALAFEEAIKDTKYFKYYRLKNEKVPKDV